MEPADDGIRETHGLAKPKILISEGECGHVVIGWFLEDRHLTPEQARYVADRLRRLAMRIEDRQAKPDAEPEQEPPPLILTDRAEPTPGEKYEWDKAQAELADLRKENRHLRHRLSGYIGHSVRWGRGHLARERAEAAQAEPEPAEGDAVQ